MKMERIYEELVELIKKFLPGGINTQEEIVIDGVAFFMFTPSGCKIRLHQVLIDHPTLQVFIPSDNEYYLVVDNQTNEEVNIGYIPIDVWNKYITGKIQNLTINEKTKMVMPK